MSKPAAPNESKKEKTGEIKAPKAGGGAAPSPSPSASSSKAGAVGAKVGCHALGCKEKDHKLSFCDEHFRQFKFGLINKKGEKVLDYERKLEHYQKWLKAQKVA